MSRSACTSRVFAQSLPSLSILAQVFNAGTDICSNMNRMKQRASLRFAHATAAHSWVIRYLTLVVKNTFSSFDLFLSSESYSSPVSPVMHQANLSCSSVLTYGLAIRASIFVVVLISSSNCRNTAALHGRLTNWSIVSACISEATSVPYAFCFIVVPCILVSR